MEVPSENEVSLLLAMQEVYPFLIHFRKPMLTTDELGNVLEQWPDMLRKQVFVHAADWHPSFEGLAGWHLPKNARLNLTIEQFGFYKQTCCEHNLKTSSGAHSLLELQQLSQFDWVLCSPVFDSISKVGHHAEENWIVDQHDLESAVALGGVTPAHFNEIINRRFQHAALLGYIWNFHNPLQRWKNCVTALMC
ncbi:hypothetical protein [Solitalea lacus]|uniref:hypothetical protein n=1 Tax=Solitalea lacus TaxID=2911172 RepID=UPI001EDBF418|nr:hypothetical protein [Solitalea lacus]UKJ06875.1 hypothetical protein L2B55_15250 [Solitalea lacus]